MKPATPAAPPNFIWWLVWGGVLAAFTTIFFVVPASRPREVPPVLTYLPVLPLAVSFVIRWFAIPRPRPAIQVFVLFVTGLALAEGSGIVGLFLVPNLRETYFVLGLLGIFLFAPFFARRLQP